MFNIIIILDSIESNVVQCHIDKVYGVDIFDGMVLLQQMTKIQLPTFGSLSDYLKKRITRTSSVVYFVTDQYLEGSVNSFEREKRMSTGNLRFRIERREQSRTKQWAKYLRNPDNETELVSFLLNDWAHSRNADLLMGKTLYVNSGSCFYKLFCRRNEVHITNLLSLICFYWAKNSNYSWYQNRKFHWRRTDRGIKENKNQESRWTGYCTTRSLENSKFQRYSAKAMQQRLQPAANQIVDGRMHPSFPEER